VLSPILKQRQLDQEKLQEELQKLKAEYRIAMDSLIYHTGHKRDLNRELLLLHKELETRDGANADHENLYKARSTQQTSSAN
jgi:hypothetical protein